MPGECIVPNSASPAGPDVSIVIISKERHTELVGTVAAIRHHVDARAPGVSVEIVVLEESTAPNPVPGARYRHIPKRNLGFGFARNQAVRAARGRIIVFVDDDITPSEKWLKSLLAPLQDPEVVGVGGGVIPSPDGLGPVGGALGLLGFPAGGVLRIPPAWEAPVQTRTISTTNCAFRRSAYERAGGFDDAFVHGGEDSDFFLRLAEFGKLMFAGRAFVYHRQREELRAVFRWGIRRGMAYFCLDCVRRGPLFSLFGPPRRSILPKIGLALGLAVWFGLDYTPALGMAVALFLATLWAFLAVTRITMRLHLLRQVHSAEILAAFPLIITPKAVLYSPLIKLLVDAGEAIGRWRMARRYFHYRFRRPPAVYALDPEETGTAPGLSAEEALRRFREKSTGAHARIAGICEIARRLRRAPHTLFYQPLAALAVRCPGPELRNHLRSLLIDGIPLALILPAPGDSTRAPTPAELRELAGLGAEIAVEIPAPASGAAESAAAVPAEFRSALGRAPDGAAVSDPTVPPAIRNACESAGVAWVLAARSGRIRLDASPYDLPRIPLPMPGETPPHPEIEP